MRTHVHFSTDISENILYKAINKCLRVKQACVRSAILALLIQIMHEERLISNANEALPGGSLLPAP